MLIFFHILFTFFLFPLGSWYRSYLTVGIQYSEQFFKSLPVSKWLQAAAIETLSILQWWWQIMAWSMMKKMAVKGRILSWMKHKVRIQKWKGICCALCLYASWLHLTFIADYVVMDIMTKLHLHMLLLWTLFFMQFHKRWYFNEFSTNLATDI